MKTHQLGISFSNRQMQRTIFAPLPFQLLRTNGFAISPCNFWTERLPIGTFLRDIGTL